MKNYVQEGKILDLTFASATTSGSPVVVGQIAGVMVNDVAANGTGQVATAGVYTLSVKGIDGSGDSAVAVGDAIYFVAADSPKLSKKTAGVLFGYALGPVAGGATATISVKLKG